VISTISVIYTCTRYGRMHTCCIGWRVAVSWYLLPVIIIPPAAACCMSTSRMARRVRICWVHWSSCTSRVCLTCSWHTVWISWRVAHSWYRLPVIIIPPAAMCCMSSWSSYNSIVRLTYSWHIVWSSGITGSKSVRGKRGIWRWTDCWRSVYAMLTGVMNCRRYRRWRRSFNMQCWVFVTVMTWRVVLLAVIQSSMTRCRSSRFTAACWWLARHVCRCLCSDRRVECRTCCGQFS